MHDNPIQRPPARTSAEHSAEHFYDASAHLAAQADNDGNRLQAYEAHIKAGTAATLLGTLASSRVARQFWLGQAAQHDEREKLLAPQLRFLLDVNNRQPDVVIVPEGDMEPLGRALAYQSGPEDQDSRYLGVVRRVTEYGTETVPLEGVQETDPGPHEEGDDAAGE